MAIILLLVGSVAAGQVPEPNHPPASEETQEMPCAARASKVVCAHERLKEKGFGWVLPALLIAGVASWFLGNFRLKTPKDEADPL